MTNDAFLQKPQLMGLIKIKTTKLLNFTILGNVFMSQRQQVTWKRKNIFASVCRIRLYFYTAFYQ